MRHRLCCCVLTSCPREFLARRKMIVVSLPLRTASSLSHSACRSWQGRAGPAEPVAANRDSDSSCSHHLVLTTAEHAALGVTFMYSASAVHCCRQLTQVPLLLLLLLPFMLIV
eukprot:GHRQ01024899.1.p2 GENE.GHRQ01024899.1~~GHRQ01024899.1.p2  ORF type:complete len:113 (+),score=12.09 GHRQ01024899.1:804-1142(+)